MLVDFGKANVLEKARQQPDKFAQVLQKMRIDGVGPTLEELDAIERATFALGAG